MPGRLLGHHAIDESQSIQIASRELQLAGEHLGMRGIAIQNR
jgi:hypothetical protein